MTRAEQERFVGNYLRGEMSAAQEQEFFIQVALDSDLRQTLKAFRVVDTAIQKHREAISPNHTESYNKFMAMLGASATEPAAMAGVTSTLMQRGLSYLGTRLFSWTTAVVATGALTIGAFIIGPIVYQSEGTVAQQTQTAGKAAATTRAGSLVDEGTEAKILPQPAHEITTGSSAIETNTLSAADATTKRSIAPGPTALAADAHRKHSQQQTTAEENTAAQDPFAAMLQEIAAQKSTTSSTSSKSKVRVIYNWPDNRTQDTIRIPVQFDGKGMKQQPN